VKQRTTSLTLSGEGETAEWLHMEGERLLRPGTYSRGQIPLTAAGEAPEPTSRNPRGEFGSWGLITRAGDDFQDRSSLVFPCDEAVEAALAGHHELDEFSDPANGCMVSRAQFNATPDRSDPSGIAGQYRWNLTFSRPAREKGGVACDVLVRRDIKKDIVPSSYSVNTTVEWKDGPTLTPFPPGREELAPELLTLASSEELFREHSAVDDALTGMMGEPDLEDMSYGVYRWGPPSMAGGEGEYPLVQDSYLDLSMPSGKCLWHLYKEISGSRSVSACIDAQTGATLYVLTVETGRSNLV
jgi:hypothetical protein